MAQAASLTRRLYILSREVDRLVRLEQQLAEDSDLGAEDGDVLETFEAGELLQTILDGDETMRREGAGLAYAHLRRRVAREELRDAEGRRVEFFERRRGLDHASKLYDQALARFVASVSAHNPLAQRALAELEEKELAAIGQLDRVREVLTSARRAEIALDHLKSVLEDAVDWVPGDPFAGEEDEATVRHESIDEAAPWMREAQLGLGRTQRGLEDLGSEVPIEFQEDLLQRFADYFLDGLVRDLLAKDGLERTQRAVTRALALIRTILGQLSRKEGVLERDVSNFPERRRVVVGRRF